MFDDVNRVFIAGASLTDGYPVSARIPLLVPSPQEEEIIPLQSLSVTEELSLLKSDFWKSWTEAYVPKILTRWCLFRHLAPHGAASAFSFPLRSFISSFFIRQVFLLVHHMPGLFQGTGQCWLAKWANSLQWKLTLRDPSNTWASSSWLLKPLPQAAHQTISAVGFEHFGSPFPFSLRKVSFPPRLNAQPMRPACALEPSCLPLTEMLH